MRLKQICYLIFIVVLWHQAAPAQENSYRLNLAKDNLSWSWIGQLNLKYQTSSKSFFNLDNHFTSNLFQKTTQGDKWKDDNDLKSYWAYRFNGSSEILTKIKSNVYSDKNAVIKFSKHLLIQEFKYKPFKEMQVIPGVGYAYEDIYGYQNQAWYTQMDAKVRNYDLGGYTNNIEAFSSLYFFPNRRNQEHRYYVAFNKEFSNLASDSIRVGYEYTENSYPIPLTDTGVENNLEDIGINSRFLYNELVYKFSKRSFLNIQTQLQNRDISQSNPSLLNHRKELNYSNRVGVYYNGQRIRTGLTFTNSQVTSLASRTPLGGNESRTDIDGLQAAFNLFMNWMMSKRDESRLTFSYTKYEYSSPDTTQTIDEDDLRFIFDLMYRHRFSSYFVLTLKANLYFYHQIYIHASRSANNNWNRIFQLAPSFWFSIPNVLVHKNQIKILANYTVYDFEDFLPEVRSYIFRKLIYSDSLSVFFSRGIKLILSYRLEKEDNGTFFKDIFAQQVSRELTSHYIDVGLVYLRIKGIQLTTALNWYLRKEWSLVPERKLIRDYWAFSPRLVIRYNASKKLMLSVDYAPRSYRDLNIPKQYFTTGRVNLTYLF